MNGPVNAINIADTFTVNWYVINFLMLLNIVLPYNVDLVIDEKLSSNTTMSPASLATSVPLPIANPTSACFNAGASFTPSPVIPTTKPISCAIFTSLLLSDGSALAITLMLCNIFFKSLSDSSCNSSEVSTISLILLNNPASSAIAMAVSFLSPVIITT